MADIGDSSASKPGALQRAYQFYCEVGADCNEKHGMIL